MRRHVGRQQVKLLHLRGPGDQLRALEHTRVVERADLDEDAARCALRARGEVHAASRAEMPGRGPVAILLVEGGGVALRELETLRGHRHEEIARAAGNFLARLALTEPPHQRRPLALVADRAAVAAAGEDGFGWVHGSDFGKVQFYEGFKGLEVFFGSAQSFAWFLPHFIISTIFG